MGKRGCAIAWSLQVGLVSFMGCWVGWQVARGFQVLCPLFPGLASQRFVRITCGGTIGFILPQAVSGFRFLMCIMSLLSERIQSVLFFCIYHLGVISHVHINSMSVVLANHDKSASSSGTWTPPTPPLLRSLRRFIGQRLRRAREHTRSVTGTSVRLCRARRREYPSAADPPAALPARVLNSLLAYYLAVTQFSLNPSLPCVTI